MTVAIASILATLCAAGLLLLLQSEVLARRGRADVVAVGPGVPRAAGSASLPVLRFSGSGPTDGSGVGQPSFDRSQMGRPVPVGLIARRPDAPPEASLRPGPAGTCGPSVVPANRRNTGSPFEFGFPSRFVEPSGRAP